MLSQRSTQDCPILRLAISFYMFLGKYFSRQNFPLTNRTHGTTQSAIFRNAIRLFPQPRPSLWYSTGPRTGMSDPPTHLVTVVAARAEAENSVKESTR